MKTIPNKVVQEKDELGNLIDINYPVQPLPSDALRIILDGLNNEWKISYDQKDVDQMTTDYASLKEIIDLQIIEADLAKNKPTPVDPDPIDPVDPVK